MNLFAGPMLMQVEAFHLIASLRTLDESQKRQGLFGQSRCPMAAATEAMAAAKTQQSGRRAVAVLPVFGMITPHGSWMSDVFGGTSLDSLRSAFDAVMADPRITDVVLQFHSPGGEVYGVKEMADHIYSQRGVKNIVAVADTLMCSAAYYLGAAAERVYVSPTAKTGSVGVVQVAVDESQALAESGIKVEINRIPEGKFRGSGLEPITDDDRRHSAESIGRIYDQFTADVSRYRGVPQSVVKASFGNGRDVDAGYAVDNSMADRIGSMSDVLAKALSGTLSRSLSQTSTRAEEPTVDIRRKKLALMSTAR